MLCPLPLIKPNLQGKLFTVKTIRDIRSLIRLQIQIQLKMHLKTQFRTHVQIQMQTQIQKQMIGTMLEAVELPASIADLAAGLAHMDADALSLKNDSLVR